MVASAGYDLRPDAAYRWHGLERGEAPMALFQYTLSGRGHLDYEGTRRTVEPGQAMLLTIPHDHCYFVRPADPWEFAYLVLHGREVLRVWSQLVASAGPVVDLPLDAPPASLALGACRRVLAGLVASAWDASREAYGVTMSLGGALLPGGPGRWRTLAIQRAVAFAREHLDEPIGVDDLAQAAGLSRSHFSRRFRASEGVSPGRYLSLQRIRRAADLLRRTTAPVAEVAARVGLPDASYFIKVFRRHLGVPPAEFRRRGL
jgi:AraC-like DNA-binding protein